MNFIQLDPLIPVLHVPSNFLIWSPPLPMPLAGCFFFCHWSLATMTLCIASTNLAVTLCIFCPPSWSHIVPLRSPDSDEGNGNSSWSSLHLWSFTYFISLIEGSTSSYFPCSTFYSWNWVWWRIKTVVRTTNSGKHHRFCPKLCNKKLKITCGQSWHEGYMFLIVLSGHLSTLS